MGRFDNYLAERARELEAPPPLTNEELAVVFLVSHGKPYREIAEDLHVAPDTVKHRLERARTKLGARTTVHTVATAFRLSLID